MDHSEQLTSLQVELAGMFFTLDAATFEHSGSGITTSPSSRTDQRSAG